MKLVFHTLLTGEGVEEHGYALRHVACLIAIGLSPCTATNAVLHERAFSRAVFERNCQLMRGPILQMLRLRTVAESGSQVSAASVRSWLPRKRGILGTLSWSLFWESDSTQLVLFIYG